jgi:hypothetical protein
VPTGNRSAGRQEDVEAGREIPLDNDKGEGNVPYFLVCLWNSEQKQRMVTKDQREEGKREEGKREEIWVWSSLPLFVSQIYM